MNEQRRPKRHYGQPYGTLTREQQRRRKLGCWFAFGATVAVAVAVCCCGIGAGVFFTR
jgi:hypothetical protein